MQMLQYFNVVRILCYVIAQLFLKTEEQGLEVNFV